MLWRQDVQMKGFAVSHLVYKHGQESQNERPDERAELRVEEP